MKHITATFTAAEQFAPFFSSAAVQTAAKSAHSVLIQLFVGQCNDAWIISLVKAAQDGLPQAVIVGVTSAGEICAGRVSLESTVVSVTAFDSASLYPIACASHKGDEYTAGQAIAEALQPIPHLQGILLLATPTRINCANVLKGIEDRLPTLPVFGGGAAETLNCQQSRVFLHTALFADGCVAVGLAGAQLRIETHITFGWQALGPQMALTAVDGFNIQCIDDKPALDVYRKYLGIHPDDEDMYLVEFPLLIERHGTQIARNPVSANQDGSVTLVADIYQDEIVRLGYLNIDLVLENTRALLAKLATFVPEAVYLYSCICRRFTLQQDVELETYPFQALAPVAGFFTSGEFCRNGKHLQQLNSSQIVVAMREAALVSSNWEDTDPDDTKDRYRFRHARITSHLLHFIATLSDELEAANSKLRHLAEHDTLTGALNRRALDRALDTELALAERYNRHCSLVMFDLDCFKQFNDNYGHSAGDIVLTSVAQAVRQTIRRSDMLFRFGGEEFLLLLPETATEGAWEIAEKTRLAIAQLALSYAETLLPKVTASFGVASYPAHGQEALALINAADAALYQAKAQGRNRVLAFVE
ncbi:GGDEF domain-containing protein [Methylovulum psychrotolerans]|uniref:sensor domain-containing diguanylate cyclase n=1 Tax=Methylovulum psychrotolerans TaxID=1704499 RepID=UPI001BFF9AF7|nr:diguanylate cyclase [Methylovulum psychrotolerans]MBT9098824.1 GGDEF domain-containing protein [Methylovulum psychrotolerans]